MRILLVWTYEFLNLVLWKLLCSFKLYFISYCFRDPNGKHKEWDTRLFAVEVHRATLLRKIGPKKELLTIRSFMFGAHWFVREGRRGSWREGWRGVRRRSRCSFAIFSLSIIIGYSHKIC